ncbi:hypothetical protein [Nannocystis radixulma]|uniref:Uncharacterized protein n=1 Tax=Nannocystis radixulma TaxID=2995305 RepID=A0ABT5BE11_9BACT|nr:hypothetical protein [Nannocystis radixulma]MDC0671943.1 hypothetical protein [Nannocystis radixulma]
MVLRHLTALAGVLTLYACHGEATPSASGAVDGEEAVAHAGPFAPGVEPGSHPEELAIGGVRLHLDPDSCTLTSLRAEQIRSHRLALAPPCHFSAPPGAAPRVVPTDAGDVVIVESSRPSAAPDCDTGLQGLVVRAGEVRPASEVQEVTACPPYEWDDIMYHAFAFDTTDPAR